jgi:hypothetical protein
LHDRDGYPKPFIHPGTPFAAHPCASCHGRVQIDGSSPVRVPGSQVKAGATVAVLPLELGRFMRR